MERRAGVYDCDFCGMPNIRPADEPVSVLERYRQNLLSGCIQVRLEPKSESGKLLHLCRGCAIRALGKAIEELEDML